MKSKELEIFDKILENRQDYLVAKEQEQLDAEFQQSLEQDMLSSLQNYIANKSNSTTPVATFIPTPSPSLPTTGNLPPFLYESLEAKNYREDILGEARSEYNPSKEDRIEITLNALGDPNSPAYNQTVQRLQAYDLDVNKVRSLFEDEGHNNLVLYRDKNTGELRQDTAYTPIGVSGESILNGNIESHIATSTAYRPETIRRLAKENPYELYANYFTDDPTALEEGNKEKLDANIASIAKALGTSEDDVRNRFNEWKSKDLYARILDYNKKLSEEDRAKIDREYGLQLRRQSLYDLHDKMVAAPYVAARAVLEGITGGLSEAGLSLVAMGIDTLTGTNKASSVISSTNPGYYLADPQLFGSASPYMATLLNTVLSLGKGAKGLVYGGASTPTEAVSLALNTAWGVGTEFAALSTDDRALQAAFRGLGALHYNGDSLYNVAGHVQNAVNVGLVGTAQYLLGDNPELANIAQIGLIYGSHQATNYARNKVTERSLGRVYRHSLGRGDLGREEIQYIIESSLLGRKSANRRFPNKPYLQKYYRTNPDGTLSDEQVYFRNGEGYEGINPSNQESQSFKTPGMESLSSADKQRYILREDLTTDEQRRTPVAIAAEARNLHVGDRVLGGTVERIYDPKISRVVSKVQRALFGNRYHTEDWHAAHAGLSEASTGSIEFSSSPNRSAESRVTFIRFDSETTNSKGVRYDIDIPDDARCLGEFSIESVNSNIRLGNDRYGRPLFYNGNGGRIRIYQMPDGSVIGSLLDHFYNRAKRDVYNNTAINKDQGNEAYAAIGRKRTIKEETSIFTDYFKNHPDADSYTIGIDEATFTIKRSDILNSKGEVSHDKISKLVSDNHKRAEVMAKNVAKNTKSTYNKLSVYNSNRVSYATKGMNIKDFLKGVKEKVKPEEYKRMEQVIAKAKRE